MIDLKTHYEELNRKFGSILQLSLHEDRIEIIAKNHSTIFDINIWLEILKNRPEFNILQTAVKEYQMALFSINSGMYSQAFTGLRFFLERTLVAIMFSATEIELRLWEKGERDTYWNEIMDENKGIFSPKFCKAFFPDLKDELLHFKRLTEKVYRECSEFVHGNNSILSIMPDTLEFDEKLFNDWHKKALIIRRILLFVLNLRYSKIIPNIELKTIETLNIEEFGNITPISNLH